MKRRTFLPILSAGLLPSCSKKSAGNTLVVGMDMTYPPFEYKNEKGEPEGVDVRIAEELAKYLGKELKLEAYGFDGLPEALKAGKIDLVISAMTITEERRKSIDFSDPYVYTSIAMLVHKDSLIKSFEELKTKPDLKISAKIGTTGESFAREVLPQAKITVLDDEVACVQEVALKHADAFIYDQLSLHGHAQKNPNTRAILTPIRDEAWGIGIKKGNDELRGKVNAFIKEFREKGGLQRLADQFLVKERQLLESMGAPFIFR